MKKRIAEKCEEIELYCEQLREILPDTFSQYDASFEKRAACERFFEKIVEAALDLAHLIVRAKRKVTGSTDKDAFEALAESGIVSEGLATRLQDAKGMRNIIAHRYGTINDQWVFQSLRHELLSDVLEFVDVVRKA